MSGGITLDAGSGGSTLGTDQVAGPPAIDYEIVKIGFSVSGSTPTQVSQADGLPTTPGNVTPVDHADVTVPAPLAAPVQNAPTTASAGGNLATGTYYYVITALNANGETVASNEESIAVTGPTGEVSLSWGAVAGATGYRVYRGTAAGAENVYYAPGNQTAYTDTGAASTAGSPPTFNSTSTDTSVSANANRKSVTVFNLAASANVIRLRLHGGTEGGIEIQPGMSYNVPTQSALDVYNAGAAVTYGWTEYV